VGILVFIVIGAVAGWLASLVVRGGGLGIIGDIVVGILGAFIGGAIVNLLGGVGVTGLNIWSVFVAFLGALVFLFILRTFTGRQRSTAG